METYPGHILWFNRIWKEGRGGRVFPEKTVNRKSLFSSESLFVGSVYFLGTFLCCDRRQLVKSWEVLIDLLHFPQTDVRMFQEYKIAFERGVQEKILY